MQFHAEDYESCGRTLLDTFYAYLPGQQRSLLLLIEAVVKAFAQDFPEALRQSEIRRINKIDSD